MFFQKRFPAYFSLALARQFILLAVMLLAMGQLPADELVMQDGSRLIGEVVKRKGGLLEFKTTYAGVIQVQWDQVREIHGEKPMSLLLEDERSITAKHLVNSTDGIILYDDIEPDLSQPSLAQEELVAINPEPWRTGEGYKLDGHVNFALKKERGNTDKDEIDVDGDVNWRYRDHRLRIFGTLENDRNDNKKTKDKWRLNNSYDYFLTKKWFAGAFLGLEHDKFADLDLRTIVGPLMGYQWFEGDKLNLSTQLGPMYVDEKFDSNPDDNYWALGWHINFDIYLLKEIMQFYHRQGAVWSLEDTNNLVWDAWTGLRFPLVWGFVASTEIQTELDTASASGKTNLDTTYRLKLGYQW